MSDNTRYLYEIRPIGPIKDLIPNTTILKPCSMHLTKEEVLKCMERASVWRKYPTQPMVKVTKENVDVLHQKSASIISISMPDSDKKFFMRNIKKVLLDTNTSLPYFADNYGNVLDDFSEKYRQDIAIMGDYAIINSIPTVKIPVEPLKKNTQNTVEVASSKSSTETYSSNKVEDKDFLSESEEESSAHTYNNNKNSSSKKGTKVKFSGKK